TSLDTVARVIHFTSLVKNALEAYANYLAGVLIIGTAATRQLRQYGGNHKQQPLFSAEPFKNAFWRCVCILASGGVILDGTLSNRLLEGTTLSNEAEPLAVKDLDSPIKVGFLTNVEGYEPTFARILRDSLRHSAELEMQVFLMQFLALFLARQMDYRDL